VKPPCRLDRGNIEQVQVDVVRWGDADRLDSSDIVV